MHYFENGLKLPQNIIPRLNESQRFFKYPDSTLRLAFRSSEIGQIGNISMKLSIINLKDCIVRALRLIQNDPE